MKTCTNCGKDLHESKFYRNRNVCKVCCRISDMRKKDRKIKEVNSLFDELNADPVLHDFFITLGL